MSPNDTQDDTATPEKTAPQQQAAKSQRCAISSLIALCALGVAITAIFCPDLLGQSARHEPATKVVWLTEMMKKTVESISRGGPIEVRTLTTLSSNSAPGDVSMEIVCRPGSGSFDCNPFSVVASPNMEAKVSLHVGCQVSPETTPRQTLLIVRCGGYSATIAAFEYQEIPTSPPVEIVVPPGTVIMMGLFDDPSEEQPSLPPLINGRPVLLFNR